MCRTTPNIETLQVVSYRTLCELVVTHPDAPKIKCKTHASMLRAQIAAPPYFHQVFTSHSTDERDFLSKYIHYLWHNGSI